MAQGLVSEDRQSERCYHRPDVTSSFEREHDRLFYICNGCLGHRSRSRIQRIGGLLAEDTVADEHDRPDRLDGMMIMVVAAVGQVHFQFCPEARGYVANGGISPT